MKRISFIIITLFISCNSFAQILFFDSAIVDSSQISVQHVSCFGGSDGAITFTQIFTPPATFLWSNMATTQSISGLTAGVYELVLNSNRALSVQINEPNMLQATFVPQNIDCRGDNSGSIVSTLSGGTPPFNFLWSDGQTTLSLSNIFAGAYTLTVTGMSCPTDLFSSDTILLQQPPQLEPSLNIKSVDCFGEKTGRIEINTNEIIGSGGPYSYLWKNDTMGIIGTDTLILNQPAGNYSLEMYDSACFYDTTLIIEVKQPSDSIIINKVQLRGITCADSANGIIEISAIGGTPWDSTLIGYQYQYQWNDTLLPTFSRLENLQLGNYAVLVSDSVGCEAFSFFTINDSAILKVNVTDVVQGCFGLNNGEIVVTASGGLPSYSYLWNDSIGQTTDIAIGLDTGTYQVTVTDSYNCLVISSNTTISDPDSISATIVSVSPAVGNQLNGTAEVEALGGTPPYQYEWSNSETTKRITGLAAGQYTITVTDANTCTNTNTAIVGLIIGLEEPELSPNETISIYPNPIGASNKKLQLYCSNPEMKIQRVLLTSAIGQVMIDEMLNIESSQMKLDLPELSQSIYIITVFMNNKLIVKRLVVAN